MVVPTIHPQDEVLNIPDAAAELDIAPLTCRLWILSGKLPGRPLGHGRFLIRREDLNALRRQRAAQRAE
jgi:hypothetical protein